MGQDLSSVRGGVSSHVRPRNSEIVNCPTGQLRREQMIKDWVIDHGCNLEDHIEAVADDSAMVAELTKDRDAILACIDREDGQDWIKKYLDVAVDDVVVKVLDKHNIEKGSYS